MQDYKYCPMCRTSLGWDFVEGRDRLTCKGCGWINYRNPLPVIACIVSSRNGELLLIKRGVEPSKGRWALPGGFIEAHETSQEAGCRELREETGLAGEPGRLVGVYSQESRMYGSVLVIGMEFTVEKEDTRAGCDAKDAKFITPAALPNIPFISHRKLIENFLCA